MSAESQIRIQMMVTGGPAARAELMQTAAASDGLASRLGAATSRLRAGGAAPAATQPATSAVAGGGRAASIAATAGDAERAAVSVESSVARLRAAAAARVDVGAGSSATGLAATAAAADRAVVTVEDSVGRLRAASAAARAGMVTGQSAVLPAPAQDRLMAAIRAGTPLKSIRVDDLFGAPAAASGQAAQAIENSASRIQAATNRPLPARAGLALRADFEATGQASEAAAARVEAARARMAAAASAAPTLPLGRAQLDPATGDRGARSVLASINQGVGQMRPFAAGEDRANAVNQRLVEMQRGFELNTKAASGFGGTAAGAFVKAQVEATNFTRIVGTLAKGALFAAIGGGIAGVIGRAKSLSDEIKELQRVAEQPVTGFWSNWATGWQEIVFGARQASAAAIEVTDEMRRANRLSEAGRRFETLTREPDVVRETFEAAFVLNPRMNETQLRQVIADAKDVVERERFTVEIEQRARVAQAGGEPDVAANLAQMFGRTDVFAQLGATIAERMAAIEGMVAGRVALPQGDDFNTEYFRQEFGRLTAVGERREYGDRARRGELSGQPDPAAAVFQAFDRAGQLADLGATREDRQARIAGIVEGRVDPAAVGGAEIGRAVADALANQERAGIDRDARRGQLRGAPDFTAELLQQFDRAGRLADLGATPDDRRASAEGRVKEMADASQRALAAQDDVISQWRELSRAGPKFASADVLGSAEATRAINQNQLGGEWKDTADKQLTEQQKMSRSLDELVRQRIVLAVANLD